MSSAQLALLPRWMWLCLAPKAPAEGVRQERIFGRIWYHNLSFTKRKQTGESRSEPSLCVAVPPAVWAGHPATP